MPFALGGWLMVAGVPAPGHQLRGGAARALVGLLWNGSKIGAIVGVALLPFEALFWIGFALPFPWVIGLARLGLVALTWKSLHWPVGRSRSP